jgi:hypothetical protein
MSAAVIKLTLSASPVTCTSCFNSFIASSQIFAPYSSQVNYLLLHTGLPHSLLRQFISIQLGRVEEPVTSIRHAIALELVL